MSHACNHSYLEGSDQEDSYSRPVWVKKFVKSHLSLKMLDVVTSACHSSDGGLKQKGHGLDQPGIKPKSQRKKVQRHVSSNRAPAYQAQWQSKSQYCLSPQKKNDGFKRALNIYL
jgi:hypothetical protein